MPAADGNASVRRKGQCSTHDVGDSMLLVFETYRLLRSARSSLMASYYCDIIEEIWLLILIYNHVQTRQ